MTAAINSLDYIAVAHLDHRARDIAEIMLAHSGDPQAVVERIVEWHDDNAEIRHCTDCDCCGDW